MEQSNIIIQSFQTAGEELVNENKRLQTANEELINNNKRLQTENEELINNNKRLQKEKEELVNENKRLQKEKEELVNERKCWEYYAQVLESFVWGSWLEDKMYDFGAHTEYLGERDQLGHQHPDCP